MASPEMFRHKMLWKIQEQQMMMFDAAERKTTVTFEPTDDYSLVDVADTVEGHADDCFITDFEDALTLWGIPYTRDEKVVPLVA